MKLGGKLAGPPGCGVEDWLGICTCPGLGIFAVKGGPIDVLPLCGFSAFGVLGAEGFFGFGGAPPYFSSSSWVESYFVADFSFSMVLVRSACWASRRCVTVSTR